MTSSSPLKHNKKRNVGLVYELISRYLAEGILAGDDVKVTKVKTLAQKHFNRSTALYKELRLFRALSETRVPTKESAQALLEKVQGIAKLQSQTRLDLEKTALLHEINHEFGSGFFQSNIHDYRLFATIQVLLNEWRGKTLFENISEIADLESKVLTHLTSEEKKSVVNLEEIASSDANGLLLKIMAEKINNKFGSSLNEDQRRIVQLYGTGDKESLVKEITTLRDRVLLQLSTASEAKEFDKVVKEKLVQAKILLEGKYSDTTKCDEEMISYYLGMSKLEKELVSG